MVNTPLLEDVNINNDVIAEDNILTSILLQVEENYLTLVHSMTFGEFAIFIVLCVIALLIMIYFVYRVIR